VRSHDQQWVPTWALESMIMFDREMGRGEGQGKIDRYSKSFVTGKKTKKSLLLTRNERTKKTKKRGNIKNGESTLP